MKTFLTLLLIALSASAQPALRIVHGSENYPGLPGLTGLRPHGSDTRSMTVWSYSPGWKLLAFNVEVFNAGDQPWTPPAHLVFVDDWTGTAAVTALLRFTLLDTNGVVVKRTTKAAWNMFWSGGDRRTVSIAAGDAATTVEPLTCMHWLNIDGVANGDYVLRVELDPFGAYGQQDAVEVELTIEHFEVRFR